MIRQRNKPERARLDDLITKGFRVKPRENAIIQDYVNRMHSQFIVDPTTKQPKRMLDNPSIGVMIKLAIFSYMTRKLFIGSYKRDNRSIDSSPLAKTKTWQLSAPSIIFRVLVGLVVFYH